MVHLLYKTHRHLQYFFQVVVLGNLMGYQEMPDELTPRFLKDLNRLLVGCFSFHTFTHKLIMNDDKH